MERLFLKEAQHRFEAGHGERMSHEGAGEEGDWFLREGIVTVAPVTSVEGVHELSFSGDHTDRHASSDDFSIGREIRVDTVVVLCSARTESESGDDFIKDKQRSRLAGDLPHFSDEIPGTKLRASTLHRLNDDGSEFACHLANETERLIGAIRQDDHVTGSPLWDAGCDWQRFEAVLSVDASH